MDLQLDSIGGPSIPAHRGNRQCGNQSGRHEAHSSSSTVDDRVLNTKLPQAWGKTPPNTGRKRTSQAALTRQAPSPGHSANMRRIFQNASTSLHSNRHTSFSGSPASSMSRIPRLTDAPQTLSTQQSTLRNINTEHSTENKDENYFTFTDQLPSPLLLHPKVSPNGTRWTTVPMADEPISSGFNSPAFYGKMNAQKSANPGHFLNRFKPKKVPLPASKMRSPSPGLDERELNQKFQNTSISDVQSWLDGLNDQPPTEKHGYYDSPSIGRNKTKELPFEYEQPEVQANTYLYSSCMGSNKENTSPSPSSIVVSKLGQRSRTGNEYPDSPSSTQYSATSSTRACTSKLEVPSSVVVVRKSPKNSISRRPDGSRRISPTPPRGHFMLPPRRKKVRSSSMSPHPRSSPVYDCTQPFEIAEDEDLDVSKSSPIEATRGKQESFSELRELSPHVTPFRKGKGPKRPRCSSYYDEDLLQTNCSTEKKHAFSDSPANGDGSEISSDV
ncbi:hypothetical protein AJ79_05403 [Helicocarpus griseus UAMH5409]|uniref:Uncharacterized protein n=1 Tax=Helicocarpus griseus UAMH5409 TaxID=1447875 RepID=A0A2B7XP94_9EURO|nr:hypothetical protein AJ79_05403 [Helicocarpus griseus UAMH5409]